MTNTFKDYWIGTISKEGKTSVFIDNVRKLSAAMRDTEIRFGRVDWIFADMETHERLKYLEGTVTTFNEEGEPCESYIELVRESYNSCK